MTTKKAQFHFAQTTPAATWTVNHNLNAKVSCDVVVEYSGGIKRKIIPDEVIEVTNNQLVIEFTDPFAGTATIVGFSNL